MDRPVRVGINGFGRIGRVFTRIAWDNPNVDIVAVNSRSGIDQYAHLLKYDSVYRTWDRDVSVQGSQLLVGGRTIDFYRASHPDRIPWARRHVDVVIESTGQFRSKSEAQGHLGPSVQAVVVSAPARDVDATVVYGVNHTDIHPQRNLVISAASCTTNCLAPIVKVIHGHLGIASGIVVSTHSMTGSQNIVDGTHKKDVRRARASGSIIPTSTGAAKAIGKLFPDLIGKLDGKANRVPIASPSLMSLAVVVSKQTSVQEVNDLFRAEAGGSLHGVLAAVEDELVSSDFIGSAYAANVDLGCTRVVGGTLVHIDAWYDNEWGYATHLVRLVEYLGSILA